MFQGLLLVIFGGVMEGSFSLPLKHTGRWNWENTWGAGSLIALLAIPWPLAISTVPQLWRVYADTNPLSIWLAMLFGAGWGIGGIFFGLGISAVGISLGLSLIMGLVAVGGSIIPLLMQSPGQLFKPAGIVLISGVVLMIFGVSVCAAAGQMKAAHSAARQTAERQANSFAKGLSFCVLAGLLSALVNFALIFGKAISESAVKHGAAAGNASNAIWALVFTANYVVNILYCLYLLRINKSFGLFTQKADTRCWLGAFFLGVVWASGIVVYGRGASRLGHFGPFLGFPIMLISSVLTGNTLGVISGEWKDVPPKPKLTMATGVLLLMTAILVLGGSASLVS